MEFFKGELNIFTLSVLITAAITFTFYVITFYRVFFRSNINPTTDVTEGNAFTLLPLVALGSVLLVLGVGVFFGLVSLETLETLGASVVRV